MASRLTLLFPIFAILGSLIAFFYPTELSTLKPLIIPLLALVMFTMGLTLTLNDFKAATKQPQLIGLALLIQFFFMPLFAWIIAASLSRVDRCSFINRRNIGSDWLYRREMPRPPRRACLLG